jgi:hypothetical protein
VHPFVYANSFILNLGLQRASEEVLRPFFLACESKNTKLVGMAVHSVQKLIAQGAIAKVEAMLFCNRRQTHIVPIIGTDK